MGDFILDGFQVPTSEFDDYVENAMSDIEEPMAEFYDKSYYSRRVIPNDMFSYID